MIEEKYREAIKRRIQMGVQIDSTTGCWVWTKGLDSRGYPRIRHLDQILYCHRVTAFLYRDVPLKLPEGVQVRHTCRNRRCVNPEHLEVYR